VGQTNFSGPVRAGAGVVVGNASGTGLQVGPAPAGGTPQNYWTWRDITGAIDVKGVGASDPTWSQFGAGPFYDYAFALNDECWFNYHIPHDILPYGHADHQGIHFHVHWYQSGTNVNPVKWQFTYAYALGFNQGAFDSTGTVITAEQVAPGVVGQHMVAETAAISITDLTEPDGIIKCHIKRIANGATDNTDTIYVPTADVHYQSTNIGTIGKAPGFYDLP